MSAQLEDLLRTALQVRADAHDVVVPPRFVPSPAPRRRHPRRLALVLASAAALTAAVVAVVLHDTRASHTPPLRVTTGQGDDNQGSHEQTSPLPRVVITDAGMRAQSLDETVIADPTSGGPGVDGFAMQSFRTPNGLGGPLLWVLTVPPPRSVANDYGFGSGRPVQVQGTTAWLTGEDRGLRLAWPGTDGGGVILASWGLSQSELVAIADGLRPRAPGWIVSDLPAGLTPSVDSPRAPAAGPVRNVQATYRDSDSASAILDVATAGPTTFDDYAMVISSAPWVEAVTVAGQQGLLFANAGASDRLEALWQPNATTTATLSLAGLSRQRAEAVVASIRIVGEGTWLAGLPTTTVRPDAVAAEVRTMEEGVPLPTGHSWGELQEPSVARDRVALAQEVVNFGVCAWDGEWLAATRAGDSGRAEAARRAVEASATWPVATIAYHDPSGAQSHAQMVASLMTSASGLGQMCN